MRQSPSQRTRLHVTLFAVAGLAITAASCTRLPRRAVQAEDRTHSTGSTQATPDPAPVNLNTASAIELEALPGVGKVLAERIVAHREQYGMFRRVEHLMMVRGFSDHKFRAVRDLVTVE